MNKQILNPLIMVFLFIVVTSILACKKSGKECPEKFYTIECEYSSFDEVFGGYNVGTRQQTIQSNCPEDAEKLAKKMSYTFGQTYERCKVVP